jgi:hypothetical protein
MFFSLLATLQISLFQPLFTFLVSIYLFYL